jgi:Fe-S-cluster containining protein
MQTVTFFEPDRGRPCDGCTKCCTWLRAEAYEYKFGDGVSCGYLKDTGCGIYETRPDGCRSFQCYWKTNLEIPEWLKPNQVNVIMKHEYISRFKYINICFAGEPDPRIYDWMEEQSNLGINFKVYDTKQIISKDKDFILFHELLSKEYGV